MDLGFSRRNRAVKGQRLTPSAHELLMVELFTAQNATPTAKAQIWLSSLPENVSEDTPRSFHPKTAQLLRKGKG